MRVANANALTFLSGVLLSVSVNIATNLITPEGIKSFTIAFFISIFLIFASSIILVVISGKVGRKQSNYEDIMAKNDENTINALQSKAKGSGIINGDIWAYLIILRYPGKKALALLIALISAFLLIVVAIVLPIIMAKI